MKILQIGSDKKFEYLCAKLLCRLFMNISHANLIFNYSPGHKGLGRQRNRSTPVTFGGMGRENMRPLVPGSPNYTGSPTSSPVAATKKHLAAAFVDDATPFSPIDEEVDLDDMPLGNLLRKSMLLQKSLQQNDTAQVATGSQNSNTLTNEETVALVTEQDESSNDFVLVDLVKN